MPRLTTTSSGRNWTSHGVVAHLRTGNLLVNNRKPNAIAANWVERPRAIDWKVTPASEPTLRLAEFTMRTPMHSRLSTQSRMTSPALIMGQQNLSDAGSRWLHPARHVALIG